MKVLLLLLAVPAWSGATDPVLRARRGLSEVVAFQDQRADLFPRRAPEGARLLTREAKEEVWRAWGRFSDYLLALESRRGAGGELARLAVRRRADDFLRAYAAFLAQYRWGMEFIERAEKDPDLHKVLDEPVPELGLPGGAYAGLKYRFLHLGRAAEFAALEAVRKSLGEAGSSELRSAVSAEGFRLVVK